MKACNSTVALIPARGGSKGIPRKNIRVMCGKPLLAWTIEVAKECALVDHAVVSTEDDEIAEIAVKWGAEVPFRRPSSLAGDLSTGIEVVVHALEQLTEVELLVLLQPTSPLRSAADVDSAVDLAISSGNPVVSVCEVDKSPYWMFSCDSGGRLVPLLGREAVHGNRQSISPTYVLNGAVYVARREHLLREKSFLVAATQAYVMPRERSVDIDSSLDWDVADMLLSERVTGGQRPHGRR